MAVPKRIIVAVTGASGAVYAQRLVSCLVDAGAEVHLIVSKWGARLLKDELGVTGADAESPLGRASDRLIVHAYQDVGDSLASGSFLVDGMIICPCSSHTLGEIASGVGDALIARAAAVSLKESRRLVLVPREMPLSPIDLRNMLRLSKAGAIVCPANPGFYMHPETIADLVDFVVGKILDLVGVPHELNTRWTGGTKQCSSREGV